jgi:transcriptional regulator with XRE-family HTH domain
MTFDIVNRADLARFGEVIRAARERKGWSQDRLAEVLGVDQSLISHYERGKSLPGWQLALKLFVALELWVRLGPQTGEAA